MQLGLLEVDALRASAAQVSSPAAGEIWREGRCLNATHSGDARAGHAGMGSMWGYRRTELGMARADRAEAVHMQALRRQLEEGPQQVQPVGRTVECEGMPSMWG